MAPKHFSLLGLGAFLLLLFIVILPAASFEFLQRLEGSQKGRTVKGVHQLKQYLKQFGYLHYDKTHAAHANDDEYDELLESAVKTYQLYYHLNVTGILDSETVKDMMQPRCGFPDIINGETRMRSGKNKKHAPHALHTVSHYSFMPRTYNYKPGSPYFTTPRWSKFHLTYTFIESEVVDVKTLRSFMPRAFQRWAAVSKFTFAEAENGPDADLTIEFQPIDGPRHLLGFSTWPPSGSFKYDVAENWSTNPADGEYDLESVAVHEIGHLLGLGHSAEFEAIMYKNLRSGTKKLKLKDDDIQGIRVLYGG